MSATPNTSALKALHPELRRRLQRLDSLERQAQQGRANRWRAPPAPGRDSDSWLVTYLDLVTLLLVMLVVLLGLSRMPSGQVDVTAGAQAAVAMAPTDTAAPAREQATSTSMVDEKTSAGSQSATSAPTVVDAPHADTGIQTPGAVALADDASVASSADATLGASAAAGSTDDRMAVGPTGTPGAPSDTGMAAGDADLPGATALADSDQTPPSATPAAQDSPILVTDPTGTADTRVASPAPSFPLLHLMETGPWTGPRLRLPDPSQPTRWSLPGFATLAELTPQPTAQAPAAPAEPDAPAPPSLDGLGLGELGEGIDVIVNEQSVSFRISNEILFPSGQADLAIGGSEVLDRLANVLARNPYPLSVEGHTDIIPIQNDRFPSNWELATARATSVVRYLSGHGIASDRMRAVGYAHTRPLTSNDTPQGRSTNRRVELIMDIPPGR